MDPAFAAVALVHIMVWAFVLLAWLSPKTAVINLTVVIPLIYALHILPFHTLTAVKQRMHPETWQQDSEAIERALVVPFAFSRANDFFSQSYANPLSPQGMLLLGAITSAWRALL